MGEYMYNLSRITGVISQATLSWTSRESLTMYGPMPMQACHYAPNASFFPSISFRLQPQCSAGLVLTSNRVRYAGTTPAIA